MSFAKLDLSSTTPKSIDFGDIYFSPHDGIGESRYHFIEGNELNKRFLQHGTQTSASFTIAETGFGTGLNFLLTAELWTSYAKINPAWRAGQKLHYISVEKHPIKAQQLNSIYRNQGWQSELTQQLLSNYPDSSQTVTHQFHLKGQYNSIQLTLLIGDATQQLSNYPFIADAWFLDGFAPNKNPEMWTTSLFNCMAEHSQSNTTFATFTAASSVRIGLQNAGFEVKKTKGFGKKRERLIGYYL